MDTDYPMTAQPLTDDQRRAKVKRAAAHTARLAAKAAEAREEEAAVVLEPDSGRYLGVALVRKRREGETWPVLDGLAAWLRGERGE
jgi:hypothetical protein